MGASSHWSNPNIGGIDPETGRQFVMYDLSFGGYGGRVDSDGPEALAPVMNCRNIPVEVHETNNPVRIHRLELIEDSGGAGRHRGGCGLRKDVELRAPSATVTLLGDRHANAPYGLFGGHPGARAETLLVRDGETEPLGSKDVVDLRGGDVLSSEGAGPTALARVGIRGSEGAGPWCGAERCGGRIRVGACGAVRCTDWRSIPASEDIQRNARTAAMCAFAPPVSMVGDRR